MSKEQDKELAALYLARSEGRVIQAVNMHNIWFDKASDSPLYYGNRVKPQSLKEAATCSSDKYLYETKYFVSAHRKGFKDGASWQKEQDNE